MRAAGIHADIAADCAGKLRAWVRRIKEAFRTGRIRDGEIGDARLHPCGAIVKIEFEDRGHFRKADHHRILLRDRATRQRGAGAARYDRNAVAMTIFHHRRHLLRRLRQCDGQRQTAIGNECIGFERHEFARFVHKTVFRQDILQIGYDAVTACDDLRTRLQKLDRLRHRPLLHACPANWYSFFTTLKQRNQMLWIFSIPEIIEGNCDKSG